LCCFIRCQEDDDESSEEGGKGAGEAGRGLKRPASAMEGGSTAPPAGAKWEYKGPDGEVHGPFTTEQVLQVRLSFCSSLLGVLCVAVRG
jgi:hypothetical protein